MVSVTWDLKKTGLAIAIQTSCKAWINKSNKGLKMSKYRNIINPSP